MWLLPSRNRPGNLARFFEAFNATEGSTYGIVLVSEADYSDNFAAYSEIELPLGWAFHPTKGEKQGEKIAEVWADVKDQPWLGLIGDDCVPRTAFWDQAMVNRLDGSNIISCNDGKAAPHRAANCWIIAGPLIRAVGYIFPPGMNHLFVDDVWETIGRGANCWTVAMEVLVEHRHVLYGKAERDATHDLVYGENFAEICEEANREKRGVNPEEAGGQWPEDHAAFVKWRDGGEMVRAVTAARELRPAVPKIPDLPFSEQNPAAGKQPAQARAIDSPEFAYQKKNLERAQAQRVMFLTPVGHRPCWQYAYRWGRTVSLMEQLGIEWDENWFMGSSDLPQARNLLSAMFLGKLSPKTQQPFTVAMLIDDDMDWDPWQVVRLLSSPQLYRGAAGRKRDAALPNTDPRAWCANFSGECIRDEMGFITSADGDTLLGTGFVAIQRDVFEIMMRQFPDSKSNLPADDRVPKSLEPWFYEFFDRPKGGGGEDFYMCRRWAQCEVSPGERGRVWVDPMMIIGHVGEHVFRGKLIECLGEGEVTGEVTVPA